jgi:DNA-binding winged helix-turn-helix (wHTH) protein/class 3 adenylate cyclase/tetratricopeptide (TPR) repeat protein
MRYLFADCILDTDRYTLERAGTTIPLRPKVFQVLRYLLDQRERVLSKDELGAQVWPAQVISDAALAGCIKRARQAIGDTGRAQRLIQTRHGHGYRFVGTVEIRAPEHADQDATAASLGLPGAPTHDPAPGTHMPAPPSEEPVRPLTGAAPAPSVLSVSPGVTQRLPADERRDGEHKLVTLLGCTLAPAMALDTGQELEALHHRMRLLYALAQRAVQQYGGTILHVAGERVLAVFGAPLAQEDHARRAVFAAWGLHQRLAEPQRSAGDPPGEPLAACIGLHTGLMVVGGMGETPEAAVMVTGDLTRAVEALQAHMVPGTLLCSDATARLVQGDVHLEMAQPLVVAGHARPLMAYKILGIRPQDNAAARHRRYAGSPFVGRARELATLHALLAEVEGGRGQVGGLVGEPGMGKSRLLTEFRHRLHGRQVTYLQGRCLAYGQATPYLSVLDLLRHACGITALDGPVGITAKVQRGLQEAGLVSDEAALVLLALLGVEAGTAALAALPPEVRKARTFATLVQLVVHRSRQAPLILEMEDLHWSDATSEAWLMAFVEQVVRRPILVLGTYRPGYRPAWLDKSYATQVALQPLSFRDSRHVMHAIFHTAQRPAVLDDAILTHADGNPFFLEELARMVVEQGERPLSLGVPDTIHAVLAARIDRLPPEEKHLLQIAAVIGTEVPVPLLHAMAELQEEALSRGLTHLQAAEFLYETHNFPEQEYTFKHALTHDVAYGSLLQERRRTLHARIVEALETLDADRLSDQVEHLAYHAFRGEVWDKALTYFRQAGAKAEARSAYQEAMAYYEQALQVLQQLPDCRATREQAIDLRLDLRNALAQLEDWGRTLALLREATTLAETLGDHRRQVLIESSLANYFRRIGDYDSALVAGQHAYTLAAALGEVSLQVMARALLGPIYYDLGHFHQAREILEENVVHLTGKQRYERFGLPCVAAVWSRVYLVMSLTQVGAFAEGHSLGTEAVQIAEAVNHLYSLMVAYYGIGFLSLRQGHLPEATAMLEHGLAVCRAGHVRSWLPLLTGGVGYAYALAGRLAESLPLLEEAVQQDTARGWGRFRAALCGYLGMAYLWAGRLAEARSLLQQSIDIARQEKSPVGEAAALYHLGEVARHGKPPQFELAEARYRQALSRQDKLGVSSRVKVPVG